MRFGTFLIAVLSALILGLSVLLAMGCGSSGDSGTGTGTETSGQQADASQTEESKAGGSGAGEPKAEPVRTGKPLTKAVFVKRADAICAVVPNEYRSLATSMAKEREAAKKPKPTVQEIADGAAIPPLEKAAAKLQSLNPPAGDVPKLEAIVAALESAAQGLGENPNSKFGGPGSPFAEFQKLTREYGLKGCAKL
ncbi:MAG TPA: hypothetical protein VHA54_12695 [Solirubrobacterales bacterium]|nr:hypothetical protein [Solirubrobacterales bacterium]